MKIYLSGPMTGIEKWNYPAFNAAAARLRAKGHEVFNPAETDGGDFSSKPREFYMREDIAAVLWCEAIALLPGWEQSKGARLEVAVATELALPLFMECDMPEAAHAR